MIVDLLKFMVASFFITLCGIATVLGILFVVNISATGFLNALEALVK